MKMFLSLILFLLPALSTPLRAATQGPSFGPDRYSAQVLAWGSVAIFKNDKPLATLHPQLFGYDPKGWEYFQFESWGGDPRYQAVSPVPKQGKVGLVVTAEISGSTLKYKCAMIPLSDVKVVSARVALFSSYETWKGAGYRWGNFSGTIPGEKGSSIILASTGEGTGSLGPQLDDGLTLDWEAKGLHCALQDNRTWTPDLTLTWDHSEPTDRDWAWKAGEEKTFEVTLQLNRTFSFPPKDAGKPSDGFAGVWCGTAGGGAIKDYRISLRIQKSTKGKWEATMDQMDGGVFNIKTAARYDPKTKGLHLDFVDQGGMELSLDPTGEKLSGEVSTYGRTFQLQFSRGLEYYGARKTADGSPVTHYAYQLPQTLSDGWKVGDLSEGGLDQGALERGVDRILDGEYPNIQGLVIVQGGKLLMDEYFYGYGPQDQHQLQSTTKSVLSLLFGIAQDKGLVKVTDKLFDYFPEFRDKPTWRVAKDKITLAHMLSMSSGFACDDWEPPGDVCNKHLWDSQDWLDFVLSLDLANPPGKKFAYATPLMDPIGAVLAMKSGMSIPDFAQAFLYDPLGIRANDWGLGPKNVTEVGGSHKLRPRDMAKLGLLYLRHGKWEGKQVVSARYLEEATRPQAPFPRANPRNPWAFDYGYLWWIRKVPVGGKELRIVHTAGRGGQYIFTVPEKDMVCVLTAGNYEDLGLGDPSFGFFRSYVLGALK